MKINIIVNLLICDKTTLNISVNDILGGDRYEQRDTTDRSSLLYIISS